MVKKDDCAAECILWALTGELWGVFREYLWKKWQCYNGTALYFKNKTYTPMPKSNPVEYR